MQLFSFHKEQRPEIKYSMIKALIIFFNLIILSLIILIYNQIVKEQLIAFNNIFILKYIPSILPFLLINNLLCRFIDFKLVYYFFTKRKLNLFFDLIIIYFFLLSGLPGGVSLLNKLEINQIYSKEKINSMITSFGTISLPFIYFSTNKNWYFILLLITFNLINYLTTNSKLNKNLKEIKNTSFSIPKTIFISLINLYIFVVLRILITIPFINIFDFNLITLLSGLFESSYSSIILFNKNEILLTIFLLSFTSFTLIYQTYKLYPHINIKSFIKKRLITALLIIIFY